MSRTLMQFCNRSTCRCKTRHEQTWSQQPGFTGRVYGYACGNCGLMPIGRDMLVSEPDKDSRWATKAELQGMRKAQKEQG